jgi:UDP:flavonoid glycosyltransferase YjiC (YdhE family)
MSNVRIVVATTPGWGHVAPVLPYAEELRRRGHELVWLTASDTAGRLDPLGYTVVPCGMTLGERLPRAAELLAVRAADVPPPQLRAHAFTTHFAVLAAPSTLDGLADLVSTWRPDVIVREPGDLAAGIVGSRHHLPVVTVGFGGIVPGAARRMAADELAPVLASSGIDPGSDDWQFGDLYLHPMPASLDREPPPRQVHRVRPPVATGSAGVEAIAALGRVRPAVHVSFGTESGDRAPWSALLQALGGLDVDALVTTGAAGLPVDAVVPPNVTVASYVDQHLVLERVAGVVSHAGSGTLLGAAAAGVPQTCVPLGADQFENAAAAAAAGIAVVIDPAHRDAASLVEAMRRMLTDRTIAASARDVADEISRGDGVDAACDHIEGLHQAG